MRLVLIAEDRVGFVTAKSLADRVLIECGPDWINADSIEGLRDWTGLDETTPFTKWIELQRHPGFPHVKVHGKSEGLNYMEAGRALTLAVLVAKDAPIDVVVLVRDLDNDPSRRQGLEKARDVMATGLPFQVIIAASDPEGEAWILHGFCVQTDAESDCLASVQARLGFDPTRQHERLRGDRRRGGKQAARDIKLVLSELIGPDPMREEICLASTPLRVLIERGRATGLADFLAEVRARILPLLDPAPPRPCDAWMD
ncbi:hypothetical protein [uncultured Thiodictyon sp.]|uniref:hypothetical protein n=1 Tax=uncultured Thiodictyon sp. TaxID=1846217 RepID=UPI0025D72523|nr:hypothetical protein [uncultured Thiodictyon sp.]